MQSQGRFCNGYLISATTGDIIGGMDQKTRQQWQSEWDDLDGWVESYMKKRPELFKPRPYKKRTKKRTLRKKTR